MQAIIVQKYVNLIKEATEAFEANDDNVDKMHVDGGTEEEYANIEIAEI